MDESVALRAGNRQQATAVRPRRARGRSHAVRSEEHALPVDATVGGSIDAPPVISPERTPEGRGVHEIRILRMGLYRADLAGIGCDIVTIGQYLRPTTHHLPVSRWVEPDETTTSDLERHISSHFNSSRR